MKDNPAHTPSFLKSQGLKGKRLAEFNKAVETDLRKVKRWTKKQRDLLELRLKRVRLWEQYQHYLADRLAFYSLAMSQASAVIRAEAETYSAFRVKLHESEVQYRMGRERKDYPFMGDPSDWNEDGLALAQKRLLKADEDGDKPREDWTFWDDLQWVYKRIDVEFVRPEDFPTIKSLNLFRDARTNRDEFIKRYFDFEKSVHTRRKEVAPVDDEQGAVEKEVPFEETPEFHALQTLKGLFSKEG